MTRRAAAPAQETARQLALGMAYEDTIRVAELKIRPSRFERVRAEVRVNDGQILEIAEFMHPRTQEIADTLPAPLGRFILDTDWVRGLIDRMTRKGTHREDLVAARLPAALRWWRRSSRCARARCATASSSNILEDWLATVTAHRDSTTTSPIEVAAARNLVKGYGDTHERGRARFETLIKPARR